MRLGGAVGVFSAAEAKCLKPMDSSAGRAMRAPVPRRKWRRLRWFFIDEMWVEVVLFDGADGELGLLCKGQLDIICEMSAEFDGCCGGDSTFHIDRDESNVCFWF